MGSSYDAIVVGSGPNGLSAAITLAQAGWSVLVREAEEAIGGGARSAELTLPGFIHDECSAIHPFVPGSPFLRSLPLADHGLEMVESPAAVAHPLDDGTAVVLTRSLDETAAGLGHDGEPYARLFRRLVDEWPRLEEAVLAPLVSVPRHPVALARFGLPALRSAVGLARAAFDGERARALLGGSAAHSMLPLDRSPSAAFAFVLHAIAHRVGWPFPRGGAQAIADALVSYLRSLGGEIEADAPVRSLDELPRARAVLLDLTPRQVLAIAGDRLPSDYRRKLTRFRYGPGAFKVDFALDGPIPWTATECSRAATVHVAGRLAELVASERSPWEGRHAERPFVLLAQHTLFDPTRAPEGKHTAWAYCHVPHGSSFDMTERIERQIERFAPGFRDRILARSVMGPAGLENRNANLVGGDLNGGAHGLRQMLARPTVLMPYSARAPGLFLCSASTPPGGGVHGMCGHLAARAALRARGR